MKLYKLTNEKNETQNNTLWGENVTNSAKGSCKNLCSDGWIHAYEYPEIAVFMNPIHANFNKPKLWEAEGTIGIREGQLKCGCKSLTTLQEIELPKISTEQRVEIGILCAKEVCTDPVWNSWADRWLSGEDRSVWAAEAAWAAWAAAEAARAAEAAARAARAEKWAAWAAESTLATVDLISIIRKVLKGE